ncbi:hypothetical protein ACWGN5_35305 [Streptomyces sp. NPDC055815]
MTSCSPPTAEATCCTPSATSPSLFARRRPPRTYPVCPWGSTDGLGCGRDPFGRLLHDHCRTPSGPVPAWRAKTWALWTWRTARALDSLAPHLIEHRPPQSVDMRAPGRIEKGMIGPVILLIGRDGPAQRARASHSALTPSSSNSSPPTWTTAPPCSSCTTG